MSALLIQHRENLSETKRKLLETCLLQGTAGAFKNPAKIGPRPKGEIAPLSLAQEQIWRREEMLPGGPPVHNESITIRVNKWLDAAVLQRSFAEIIRRHEIWRTNYKVTDGQPIQVVHEPSDGFPLRIVDLRAVSQAEQKIEMLKLYTDGVRQRFDLSDGPLLRAMLVILSDTDQRILVFAHLSILDGISVYQILPAELTSLYDAFVTGDKSPLAELPIQFADYAYWQRQWLNSQELTEQLTYWREQLGGELPVLQWPSDRPRSGFRAYHGATRSFALQAALRGGLKRFSRRQGVTLFTTLAASLSVLLYCYTRQVDILLGTPSLGARKQSDAQNLLGHFLNPVALRLNLEGDPSFREVLLHTREVLGNAVSHDDVPPEILAQNLGLSRSPLFTVAISLQPQTPETGAGWHVTSMDADSGGTIWDLYVAFIDTPDGVIGRAQYNTDFIKAATVTRTLDDLQILMKSVVDHPEQRISCLPSQLPSPEALS